MTRILITDHVFPGLEIERQVLAPLDAAKQATAWAAMEARLQKFASAEGWEGPNEILLTAGRR